MNMSSPNRIIWEYFKILEKQLCRTDKAKDDSIRKGEALLCVFLAVSVVETFINLYFRIIVLAV